MRLTVPRRGGWRTWGAVRGDFEGALAGAADPAIASAEIASELRRGADYVRVSLAFTVVTTDVADALAIAWGAFRGAARDDLAGWEVTAAAAEVQPEPPLTSASGHGQPHRVTPLPPGGRPPRHLFMITQASGLRNRELGNSSTAAARSPRPSHWPDPSRCGQALLTDDGTGARNKTSSRRPAASVPRPAAAA